MRNRLAMFKRKNKFKVQKKDLYLVKQVRQQVRKVDFKEKWRGCLFINN